MRITINEELCQGHGRCYEIAPQVFTDDDRGRGQLLIVDIPTSLEQEVRNAAGACPERAIIITD